MSKTNDPLAEALAFLYLTFGQATDGTLTSDEMRTLAAKLCKRAPDLSLEDVGAILRSTVETYKEIGTRQEKLERAQQHAVVLRDVVDDKMRTAILADLSVIAHADGEVSEEEEAFIARTAESLGVDPPK